MTQPPAPNLGPASSQFESQPPQKRGDISRFLSFPAKSGNISRSLEIARNFVPSSNLGQMVLIWHFCNNLQICYIRRGKGPHLRFCQKWKFRCWRALGYQCSYSPNPRYRRPWTHFLAATIRLNTFVENWWLVGWIIPDSRFEMVPGPGQAVWWNSSRFSISSCGGAVGAHATHPSTLHFIFITPPPSQSSSQPPTIFIIIISITNIVTIIVVKLTIIFILFVIIIFVMMGICWKAIEIFIAIIINVAIKLLSPTLPEQKSSLISQPNLLIHHPFQAIPQIWLSIKVFQRKTNSTWSLRICTLTRTRESYPKIPFLEPNMKIVLWIK